MGNIIPLVEEFAFLFPREMGFHLNNNMNLFNEGSVSEGISRAPETARGIDNQKIIDTTYKSNFSLVPLAIFMDIFLWGICILYFDLRVHKIN